jgi:mannose-6-phosphate isomerase
VAEPDVFEIGGVLRRYAWGSTTLIQQLVGLEPDGRPAAELWFGTHPGDPSRALGTTLDHVLAEAGEPHLPFLLKILAAEQALSIQVHPTRAQAEAGFDREEAAGIPIDARERNYVDRNHKPELLCALTPFEGLCGFRPVAETLALLDDIGAHELDFVADLLRGPAGLRAAFTAVLTHADPGAIIAAVRSRATPDGPLRPQYLIAEHFPDDIGLVVSLLLNHVRLEPGQAFYLAAGNVHCYLRGMGVEVMAASDNVLRCGVTSKHIDVPELIAIADFTELSDPIWPEREGRYVVTVPDFVLAPVQVADEVELPPAGPRIVLATDGRVRVDDVELAPGRAAFVRPQRAARLAGTGQVFVASGE